MHRRRLLETMGVAAAATLTAPAVSAIGRREHRVARLEIIRLPVNRRGDWLILRLHTDTGLIGLGDASHSGDDTLTIAWLKRLADVLRNRSIFAVEPFRKTVHPSVAAEPKASAIVAAGALEQCLWDLSGQALGVPVSTLFGGAIRDRVPLYANINRSTDPRTPAGFAAKAQEAIAAGFDAVKLAPFDAMPVDLSRTTDVTPLIDEGIACALAVRQVIGPDRKLLIDAHSRFTRAEGLALTRRLEPLNLFWLEEVTPAMPVDDLVAIDRASKMPTAGGETIRWASGFYEYLHAGAVDIAMPDIKLCGGPLELKTIGGLAEAAGKRVSPHGPASPIGGLSAAHVATTLPNFDILEHAFGEVPWRAELIEPAEHIDRGALVLSNAPGLGARLNMETVERRGQLL